MMSPLLENLETVLIDFREKEGFKGLHILNVSADIEAIQQALQIHRENEAKFPELIKTGFGIHPELFFKENDFKRQIIDFDGARKVLTEYEKLLTQNIGLVDFIGETGLDYHQFYRYPELNISDDDIEKSKEIQKLSFRRQLELAMKHNLPLSIHSRDKEGSSEAVQDCLELICEVGKGKIRGCMHSYTGELENVGKILDIGLFIGFNPIVTYKNAQNVRDILCKTPIERVLTETDAPLLPIRVKGATKYGQPSDVYEVLNVIGMVKGLDASYIEKVIDESFISLL